MKKAGKSKKRSKKPAKKVTTLAVNEFVQLETGLQIGEVYIKSIKQRKTRFRKMDELQMQALKDSIGRLGPRDPVIVIPGKKSGEWELIDGHHRIDELSTRGYDTTPVVVLTDKEGKAVSPADADLAMFSFNVSAELDEKGFFEVIREMREDQIPINEIATATARDKDALEELLGVVGADEAGTMQPLAPMGSLGGGARSGSDDSGDDLFSNIDFNSIGGYGAESGEDGQPVQFKESSRGMPIMLSLPGTDEIEDMLEDLCDAMSEETRSGAVVKLMKQYFGKDK